MELRLEIRRKDSEWICIKRCKWMRLVPCWVLCAIHLARPDTGNSEHHLTCHPATFSCQVDPKVKTKKNIALKQTYANVIRGVVISTIESSGLYIQAVCSCTVRQSSAVSLMQYIIPRNSNKSTSQLKKAKWDLSSMAQDVFSVWRGSSDIGSAKHIPQTPHFMLNGWGPGETSETHWRPIVWWNVAMKMKKWSLDYKINDVEFGQKDELAWFHLSSIFRLERARFQRSKTCEDCDIACRETLSNQTKASRSTFTLTTWGQERSLNQRCMQSYH